MTQPDDLRDDRRVRLSFQTRLTVTLLAAAIVPLGAFGLLLIVTGAIAPEIGARLLLFMFAVAVAVGVLGGAAIGLDLVAPLREISKAVSRVSAGDMSHPIPVVGNDVLAQLAESHNRLAGDADRRNRQLGLILAAVESAEPRDGVAAMAERAARDAQHAFGFIAAELRFVDPDAVEPEERIPGVSVPIRAELRAGEERMGLILASLPATHTWERADQTLLDLYASEIGVAIRNAELFNQVEDQNRQLRQLDEVKDDFLRGVSHNLQTPLTSIRSNADAIAASATDPDPRLSAIADQADRLSRIVQQLLLVGRLESKPPRPTADVLAIAPRIQRAWDALGVTDHPLVLRDGAPDWLAVADGDQLDQVLWALLDNAAKYGEGAVTVEIGADPDDRILWTTISDEGAGLGEGDRAWLFGRFERGVAGRTSGNGSGLGLYVSRALMRGMGGDLVLDPATAGQGTTFRLTLPGEPAGEG
ncbi:MAG: two-component system, sensor histidine kinase and response regulator [Chloroflexota bacterium]|nr:two-component system, sensor histidine kinase and response regulator [Chloroflexota bacterium]